MMNSVQESWLEAAEALEIRVEVPGEFVDANSQQFEASVYLPDFGSENGLLLFLESDSAEALEAAYRSTGYSVSLLGSAAYQKYSRESFVEFLIDWGWSSCEDPPVWYKA